MPKLRCLASEIMFVPSLGRNVEPDELVEVAGEVIAELDDAVVVNGPQGERAWPAESWALVADKPQKNKE